METLFQFTWINASQSSNSQHWIFSNGHAGLFLNNGQSSTDPPEGVDDGTQIVVTVQLPNGTSSQGTLSLNGGTWSVDNTDFTVTTGQEATSGSYDEVNNGATPVQVACLL